MGISQKKKQKRRAIGGLKNLNSLFMKKHKQLQEKPNKLLKLSLIFQINIHLDICSNTK